MPHTPLHIPIITAEQALPRLDGAVQALIDSWYGGMVQMPQSIDDTWLKGRMSAYEYALGLLLDVPGADVHAALMAGDLAASP